MIEVIASDVNGSLRNNFFIERATLSLSQVPNKKYSVAGNNISWTWCFSRGDHLVQTSSLQWSVIIDNGNEMTESNLNTLCLTKTIDAIWKSGYSLVFPQL